MKNQRYPDFLVIGAMKSGTTSLADDLVMHPKIEFPCGKEVKMLSREDIEEPGIIDEYMDCFSKAKNGCLVGDASPQYSMNRSSEIAEIASKLLPSKIKIIYMMRDPIRRAISHYQHLYEYGWDKYVSVDEALRDPTFVDISSYASKLEPWILKFGKDSVLTIKFEDYIVNRKEVVENVCAFLEIDSHSNLLNINKVSNSSNGRIKHNKLISRIRQLFWLKNILKMLIPKSILKKMAVSIAGRTRKLEQKPSKETLEYLRNQLEPEIENLKILLGPNAPDWNLQETIIKLMNKH